MSSFDDDLVSNVSNNQTFEQVLQARVSRRSVLGGGVTAAAAVSASLGGVGALLNAVPAEARGGRSRPRLGFEGVPAAAWTARVAGGQFDEVIVPTGYTAKVLIAWGDPVSNGPAFKQDATNTSADQEQQWGMHNDGMVYFPLLGSSHGLIVQNHEYTDDVLLFNDGAAPATWSAEKTKKSQAAHGVGIIEVRKRRGKWEVVRPSFFARRITGYTPIKVAGPAAGRRPTEDERGPHRQTRARHDQQLRDGLHALGQLSRLRGELQRLLPQDRGHKQSSSAATASPRAAPAINGTRRTRGSTRISSRTKPHRFGWVTEIYPYLPYSTPVKRTALGRFKHEGAWVQEARDGRVVVYIRRRRGARIHLPVCIEVPLEGVVPARYPPARRGDAVRCASSTPTARANGCR